MVSTCVGNLTQVNDDCFTVIDIYVILQDKVWFAGDCNRKIAEDLLLRINKVNKQLNDGRVMYSLFTIPLLFYLPAPFWPPLSHQNLHLLLHPFLFPIPSASFAQIIPSSSIFSLLQDGAFLIRHSSAQNARQPYTLAVLYQQKVYNIPIRFLGETRGYALGKEGKKNEEVGDK